MRADRLVGKGGPEVLDEVRPDHPPRTQLQVASHGPTDRGRMLDGNVLHPPHVGQIADVALYVDRRGGHRESLGEDRSAGHVIRTATSATPSTASDHPRTSGRTSA